MGYQENNLADKVRNGLFLAASRTYAEQYVEPFIREKYSLREPEGGDHDGVSVDGKKFEIKACKVLKGTSNGKAFKTLLDRILFENESLPTLRMVAFDDAKSSDFLANVQNVKRDHFDTLIYVLLFKDCVKVFFAETQEILKGHFASWSDKHGRYDQLGKSGQFGITRTTLQWHLDNHLADTFTYDDLTDVFLKLSLKKK